MIKPKLERYDIVLVNSPAKNYEYSESNDQYPNSPLGLGSIATYLDERGRSVGLLDAEFNTVSINKLVSLLCEYRTEYIGFNAVSENVGMVMKIAEQLPQKIILGGVHASLAPEETIIKYPFLYCLVHGEGEKPLNNILAGFPLEEINGVAFSDGDKVVINPREDRMDLNELSFINRKFFEPNRAYFMMTSRGCPHNCAFCASPALYGRVVKFRDMTKVVSEIKNTFPEHKHFHFLDDQFLITSKRAEKFLNLLKRAGIYGKITWRGMARSDIIDKMNEDLLKRLYESGGRIISIGIESGCKRILKMVHKRTNNGMVKRVVNKMSNIGWTVKGFFVLGFPTETYSEMVQTKNFIMELGEIGLDYFNISIFRPYPGTEIYGYLIGKKGYQPEEIFYESYSTEQDIPNRYIHGVHSIMNSKVQISEVPERDIRKLIKEIVTNFSKRFSS